MSTYRSRFLLLAAFSAWDFVPLWAKCLIGTQMAVPALLIFRHLCFIIVIPLVLAALTRRIILGRMGESLALLVKERIQVLSGVGLCLLVFTMSLLYGDRVLNEPLLILRIAAPVAAFLMIMFLISGLLGKIFRSRSEDAVALTLSTTAKNNAISLALAFSTFGADAALVNAIAGPLVQLPILLGFVALKRGKTIEGESGSHMARKSGDIIPIYCCRGSGLSRRPTMTGLSQIQGCSLRPTSITSFAEAIRGSTPSSA